MLKSFILLAALASAGAGLPQLANSSNPQDIPSAGRSPAAVMHDGDLTLRDRLQSTQCLWHDAGGFLVAELTANQGERLERDGVEVHYLTDLAQSESLFVVCASTPATLERIEAAGGRVLLQHGLEVLVAAPQGAAERLRGLDPVNFFHGGLAHVRRAPKAAPRAFVPPGGTNTTRSTPHPGVQAVVDLVDSTNLEQTVLDLSSIYTRCANGPGAWTARDMLVAELTSYGYTPVLEYFSSYYPENVVVELPGTVDPDKIIVIGGHYDSIAGGCSSESPGADDNATGTAGVVEAARVLALGGPWEHTLRFICFSAEEYGLIGSEYSAQQSYIAGEDIIAMLNTDMSAYRAGSDTRDVDFVLDNSSPALADFCHTVGALYVPGWASKTGSLSGGTSDHQSYNDYGFPAIFYFEDVDQYSPYIHTASDAHPHSTNDFNLSEMIVKGIVAVAATLADPVDLEITHTPLGDTQQPGPYDVVCQVTSLTSANVASVDLHYQVDGGGWTTVAMTLQGSDWVAQIPDAGSPVTIEYYITALDDQGGSEDLPSGADSGGAPFSFFVGVITVHYFNDFEASGDQGWTHGQVATQDDWHHGVVYGKAGDPSSAYSGQRLWGNDLGPSGWNGQYQPNVHNWLRSPVFDLSGTQNVHIRYRRWLTVENGVYDQAQIRVNGSVVWQNASGQDTIDTSWTLHTVDVSALAAGNPAVQVEYRLLTDGGVEYGGWNLDDFSLVSLDASGCPPPVNYCTTSPNSVGSGAVMTYGGSASVAANDLVLVSTGCPPNQFGLFYTGPDPASVPVGDGTMCIGGSLVRFPAQQVDSWGIAENFLDLNNMPGGLTIQAGDLWRYAFWYRDPGFGSAGYNFSDGLAVTFCP